MVRNKIVLVPFPFDDFSGTKVRPAICLTNEIGDYSHVVIAFITSRIPTDPLPSDILIVKGSSDFRFSGLAVNSTIRLHKLVSIPRRLISRQLGKLSPNLELQVKQKLADLFGIKS